VAVKSSAAFVIVRLIDDHGTYWWKVENHGPDTAWLKALNVVPIDAPPEAEHGIGDDSNEPTAADPPLRRYMTRACSRDSRAALACVPPSGPRGRAAALPGHGLVFR